MEHRVELYQWDELPKRTRRRGVWIAVAACIAALTLGVCVGLCAAVRTATAQRLLIACIAVSTVGGWIVLSLRLFVINEQTNAIRHTEAMLTGQKERVTGRFSLTEERVRIKNGVSMVRVSVDGADRVQSLQLFTEKCTAFPAERVTAVDSVYGFITAYEVEDAGD